MSLTVPWSGKQKQVHSNHISRKHIFVFVLVFPPDSPNVAECCHHFHCDKQVCLFIVLFTAIEIKRNCIVSQFSLVQR